MNAQLAYIAGVSGRDVVGQARDVADWWHDVSCRVYVICYSFARPQKLQPLVICVENNNRHKLSDVFIQYETNTRGSPASF